MFGLLQYLNSWNLGDNIQSIAAESLLPKIDFLVDRDTSQVTPVAKGAQLTMPEQPVFLIWNGWFDGHYTKFPLPPILRPLYESVHINETVKDKSYDCLQKSQIPFQPLASQKWVGPIFCRDPHTVSKFAEFGISASLGGCLTLTLQRTEFETSDEILLVDVPASHMHLIPAEDRKRGIVVAHAIKTQMPHAQKMQLAKALLVRYQKAQKVYTGRLHCYLPCRAFGKKHGTEVIFLGAKSSDVRFKGLVGLSDREIQELAQAARARVAKWVAHVSKPHGTSILVGIRNRLDHIKLSLPDWLALKPREIVLVDWGSSDFVDLQKLVSPHPNVLLIRVENVESWSISCALNFGARFVSGKRLLKVDCDSRVAPNFLRYHSLTGKVFFAGNWRLARDENERHTNGICYMKTKHFRACGGMNEYLGSWYGYDDCKLYRDLELIGLTRANFQPDFFTHIKHCTSIRSVQPIPLPVQIERNRIISETYGKPPAHSLFRWIAENRYEYISSFVISEVIQRECLLRAIRNHAKKKLFILKPENGLGNRMRAIASAKNIADARNMQFVIVWITNIHCMARFEDLFERSGPLEHVIVLDFIPQDWKFVRHEFEHSSMDEYDYSQKNNETIRDGQTDIFVSSACSLRSPHTSWSKQNAFLKSLIVQPRIQRDVDCFVAKNKISECIGIHIRMSQPEQACEDVSHFNPNTRESTLVARAASHWSYFAVQMRKFPDTRFFVACDNPVALHALKQEFGNRVISQDKQLYDRSREQIGLALQDGLILARCKLIWGSPYSSFSEMAHRWSDGKMELITTKT